MPPRQTSVTHGAAPSHVLFQRRLRGRALKARAHLLFPEAPCRLAHPGDPGPQVQGGTPLISCWGAVGRQRARAVLVALRSRVRAPRPGPVQSLTARGHYLVLDLPGAEPRPGSGSALSSCSRWRRQAGAIINRLPPLLCVPGPAPTKARGPRSLPRSDPSPARLRGKNEQRVLGSWHGRQCASV